jgi:hypothetical protein
MIFLEAWRFWAKLQAAYSCVLLFESEALAVDVNDGGDRAGDQAAKESLRRFAKHVMPVFNSNQH